MYSPGSTLERVGFPIQRSPGQRLLSTSPKLIAAYRVFHRRLVPRHPPYALSSLFYAFFDSSLKRVTESCLALVFAFLFETPCVRFRSLGMTVKLAQTTT